VAQGCRYREKYEKVDTCSPTPHAITVRWFLAHAIKNSWYIEQIDVDSAFLNGQIDRDKYIILPQGFKADRKKIVGKLLRPLYGLAIAPTCWNRTITKRLLEIGFTFTIREPCVFIRKKNGHTVMILLYVDDALISSSEESEVRNTINELEAMFNLKKMGFPEVSWN